jgi:DNA-binding NtrC family response regulator
VTGSARVMKRQARLRRKGILAMQLGAFDDLFMPFDIQALHNRIVDACQRKKQRVKADRSLIREERNQRNTG